MEMACDNTIEPGDKVLVVTNGIWGSRFSDMASRHGTFLEWLLKYGCNVSILYIMDLNKCVLYNLICYSVL